MNKPKLNTYIVYHDNCLDGFGAAYAAWYDLKDTAKYIPAQYNKHFAEYLPDIDKNSVIYFVDFSLPYEQLVELSNYVASITILDHHKSFKDMLDEYEDSILNLDNVVWTYDEDKSGAVIAWEYFNPNEPVPQLLLHIQDRDLWQFELDGTKEICVALYNTIVVVREFEEWEYYASDYAINKLEEAGKLLIVAQEELINSFKGKEYLPIDSNLVICNAPSSVASGLGNYLAKTHNRIALIWSVQGSEVICSLRSVGDSEDMDCTVEAKRFGGGGHHNAAGFKLKSILQLYNLFYDN